VDALRERGASFFGALHEAVGGGYPAETVDALWNLVWRGLITNDTFHALRAFTRSRAPHRRLKGRQPVAAPFRSRRLAPPSAEGRWTLVTTPDASVTRWAAAVTQQLLARHGIVTREAVSADGVTGGFALVYPVLKGMEEHGRIRRGYFVAGLGATQFAMPGALDLLRSLRDAPDDLEIAVLAATDPANPYGAALKWPAFATAGLVSRARQSPSTSVVGQASLDEQPPARGSTDPVKGSDEAAKAGRGPTRSVGATVILVNGGLAAYLPRGDRQLVTFLPEEEPDRSRAGRAVARVLIERARAGGDAPRGMLIEEIDGVPPAGHWLMRLLVEAGFVAGAMGLQATFGRPR
jgi:ATP-dependent Lhr-like helicase